MGWNRLEYLYHIRISLEASLHDLGDVLVILPEQVNIVPLSYRNAAVAQEFGYAVDVHPFLDQ